MNLTSTAIFSRKIPDVVDITTGVPTYATETVAARASLVVLSAAEQQQRWALEGATKTHYVYADLRCVNVGVPAAETSLSAYTASIDGYEWQIVDVREAGSLCSYLLTRQGF